MHELELTSRLRLCAVGCAMTYVGTVFGWLVVGDLSESTQNPDYFIRAPHVPVAIEWAGYMLAAVLGVLILTLRPRFGDRRSRLAWHRFAGSVVALGVFLGACGRVVTAGAMGANIGAGLVLFFGPAVVLPLLALALQAATHLRQAQRQLPGHGKPPVR